MLLFSLWLNICLVFCSFFSIHASFNTQCQNTSCGHYLLCVAHNKVCAVRKVVFVRFPYHNYETYPLCISSLFKQNTIFFRVTEFFPRKKFCVVSQELWYSDHHICFLEEVLIASCTSLVVAIPGCTKVNSCKFVLVFVSSCKLLQTLPTSCNLLHVLPNCCKWCQAIANSSSILMSEVNFTQYQRSLILPTLPLGIKPALFDYFFITGGHYPLQNNAQGCGYRVMYRYIVLSPLPTCVEEWCKEYVNQVKIIIVDRQVECFLGNITNTYSHCIVFINVLVHTNRRWSIYCPYLM